MAAPKQTNDRRREQQKLRKLALETGANRKQRRLDRFATMKAKVEPTVTNELKAKSKAKKVKIEVTSEPSVETKAE
jgi:hypothetical protein